MKNTSEIMKPINKSPHKASSFGKKKTATFNQGSTKKTNPHMNSSVSVGQVATANLEEDFTDSSDIYMPFHGLENIRAIEKDVVFEINSQMITRPNDGETLFMKFLRALIR